MQCPTQGMQMTALLSVVILIACQEGINSAFGFDLGSLHTLDGGNNVFVSYHCFDIIVVMFQPRRQTPLDVQSVRHQQGRGPFTNRNTVCIKWIKGNIPEMQLL